MKKITQIKKFAYDCYIAQDGLMSLYMKAFTDKKEPLDLKSVQNDNGILFLAYFLWLLDHYKALDKADKRNAFDAIERLKIAPGFYARTFWRQREHDSHDNYLAIASLCLLFDWKQPAKDMAEFGLKHGFTWDYMQIEGEGQANYRRWRFGSHTAIYKLAAGYSPRALELIWLYGSILWSSFFDKVGQTSELLLTWLVLKSLDKYCHRNKSATASVGILLGYIWRHCLLKKTDGLGIEKIFGIYFRESQHPCIQLSQGVRY